MFHITAKCKILGHEDTSETPFLVCSIQVSEHERHVKTFIHVHHTPVTESELRTAIHARCGASLIDIQRNMFIEYPLPGT